MPRQYDANGDLEGAAPAGTVTAGDVDSEASTDGHVLTSDGAGNAAWEAVSGGSAFTPAAAHVTKPGAPTGQQNCGGANGTVTVITWGAQIQVDTGFTHSTGTNPEQIQCDFDGVVSIACTVSLTQGGANRTTHSMQYRVNGGGWIRLGSRRSYTRGSIYGDSSPSLYTEQAVSNGDYIEVAVWIDDTDATYTQNTINDECDLVIRRVA